MAVKIRLTRGGSKNRPYYTIIAASSAASRDGKFLEKLGSYNPTLPKDSAERFKFNSERLQHWLEKGAQPSEVVARYLVKAGVLKEDKKVTALRDKAIAKQKAAKQAADDAKTAAEAAATAASEPQTAAEQPAA